ncbi:MAG: TMEM175 family protein [Rhodanobacter sp.]
MGNRVLEPVSDHHVGQRHLDRLVMLSDGVFAIAITLSAIEIKPAAAPGQTLWQAWSTPLLIYFLSFFLIGTVWAFHRRIVAHLRDIDSIGTMINLLLLSLVALMPVVIRFVFEDLQQGQGMLIYGIALGTTYVCIAVLWLHVAFIARLAPDLAPGKARQWLLEMLAGALIFGALALHETHWRWASLGVTLLALALLVAKRLPVVHGAGRTDADA